SETCSGFVPQFGGGGIYNGGSLTVSNSTLSGNYAVGSGAGICNNGTLTVSGSTLSGNTADPASANYNGSRIVNFGSALLHNTLIAGNLTGDYTNDYDVYGNSLDSASDYNLIGDGSGGLSTTNHNLLGTSASPLDPLLAPLGNY